MNLKFSPETTPAGSRFLYKDNRGFLEEGTIREWSNSAQYLNWNGKWMSIDELKYFTLIEILRVEDLWRDTYNKSKSINFYK